MEDYQERVVEEKSKLDERIVNLVGFIHSDRFYAVDQEERKRLRSQMYLMVDYSRILHERIDYFREKK